MFRFRPEAPYACQKQWGQKKTRTVWVSSMWNGLFPQSWSQKHQQPLEFGIPALDLHQKNGISPEFTWNCEFPALLDPVIRGVGGTSSRCKWCPPSSDRLCSPTMASLPRLGSRYWWVAPKWSEVMAPTDLKFVMPTVGYGQAMALLHRQQWFVPHKPDEAKLVLQRSSFRLIGGTCRIRCGGRQTAPTSWE